MAVKSAMIGNGKNHFSCKWQSNQERLETKKKTFVTDVSQISNDWKRKKKLLSLTSVKSAKNGNGKKNFSASCQSNQERMGTKKKTFLRHASQIRKEWKRKKLNLSASFHRCQTKCGYACSKCHVLVASRGEFSRMLIVA